MSYTVHHVDAEGRGHLEDAASLEAALSAVEELQSDGRRSQVRVFKEVPIEVRTYYRVVAVEEPGVPAETVDGPGAAPEVVEGAAGQPPAAAATHEMAAHAPSDAAPPQPVDQDAPPLGSRSVAEDMPPPEPQPEGQRLAPVFQEPPSGAVVMGPPPAQTSPAEGVAAAGESDPEPRRSRFGRS